MRVGDSELIIAEMNLEKTIVFSGSSGSFFNIFSPVRSGDQAISHAELLSPTVNEQKSRGSTVENGLSEPLDEERLPFIAYWTAYLSHLLQEIKSENTIPVFLYMIVPSWLELNLSVMLDRVFSEINIASVRKLARNYAIVQTYSAGIPPRLAAYIAVIEIHNDLITISPACREDSEWHVGKVFVRNCSAKIMETEIFEWIFSLLSEFCVEQELIALLDAEAALYEKLEEKIRLLGKSIRLELVDFSQVMQRLWERFLAYDMAQISVESGNSTVIVDKLMSQASTLSQLDFPVSGSHGKCDTSQIGYKNAKRTRNTKKSLYFLMLGLVLALIIWWTIPIHHDAEVISTEKSTEKHDADTAAEIPLPAVIPRRIINWEKFIFTLPPDWEITTSVNIENMRHLSHKHVQFLVHSAKPREVIEMKFIPQILSVEHLRQKITSTQNLNHFQELLPVDEWKKYQYMESPSNAAINTSVVLWTILTNETSTVQIGCIYASGTEIYPACQEVIDSIHPQ